MDDAVDDEMQLMVPGLVWIQLGPVVKSNLERMQACQPHDHAKVKRHASCCLGQPVKLTLLM